MIKPGCIIVEIIFILELDKLLEYEGLYVLFMK
jgi:hypothetical protein